VNTYFPGSGTATSGNNSITVAASGATGTGISAGDLLLIIQMQGADINGTDSNAYGANNASGAGNLTDNFTAGTYEYVVANSTLAAGSAGTITTTTPLANSYSTVAATATKGRRSFQVVRIPQYANVTLSGRVDALAWNGSIGGVLVMDVAGTLNLGSQVLNAAGLGFRGGAGIKYTGYAAAGGNNTTYRTPSTDATTNTTGVNGTKGEGTAGTPRYTAISNTTRVDNVTTLANAFTAGVTDGYPNGDNGRGAPGNAGGGATDAQSPGANGFNAGGAGGGNGAAGGLGGSPRNNSTTSVAPNTTVRAVGGVAFSATSTRLVMGGGGGSGSNNDGIGGATGIGSSGAAGGGIIMIRVGSLSGSGSANASGDGNYLITGGGSNDGVGGGGAGGTVLVTARNTASLANLSVTATGGAGSRNTANDVPHGPGGGGGGGIVLSNGALAAVTVTGGAAGTTTYNTVGTGSGTITFGATSGANGISNANITTPIDNSVSGADCVADLSTTITAPSTANTGQNVTAQVTFSNAGPLAAPATGTVTIPAGATVLSAIGGAISVANGVTTITYAISSLAANGSSPFTITYRPTTTGTFTVNSAITSPTVDVVTANNSALASTTVSAIGAAGTPAPCATPGKDGSPTLSVNPNTYYPGTASAAMGATSITVGAGTRGSTTVAASTISAGDLLLVMQMQGAEINPNNSDSYGDGVAGGGASGNLANANFTAGLYEYVVATNTTPIDVTAGGTITLASPLRNSYLNAALTTTVGPRRFQVVRIPQYASLTLSGTITATPWNGSIGGIIAIDVAGQTNFGSSTIDVSGRGFRGGGGRAQAPGNFRTTDYVSATNTTTDLNAQKGEGTAGTPRFVNVPVTPNDATTNATIDLGALGYPGGSAARGAPGNAGGGADDNGNNSGGGGGANGGNGGRGGNSYLDNLAIGGEPGASFSVVSSSRLVMGGGGGAGTNDTKSGTPTNGAASSGAPGGGIVLLRTGTISGSGTISANGGNANNTVADDGSGGGGAGGSILLTAKNTAGLANLTLNARGGTGGTNTGSATGTTPAHGPGGGGGGGIILTNGSVAAATATAGLNGTTKGSIAYGAAAGAVGVTSTNISTSIAGSAAGTECAADVTVSLSGPTTLNAGQPTGNFTATFTNEGPNTATNVTRTITLPAGATLTINQLVTIQTSGYPNATYDDNTKILNFGNLPSLASDASNVIAFAFTAPATTGSSTLTGNTGPGTNGTSEGINFAPNQSTLALTTITTADVRAAITASATPTTGTFNVTFSNIGSQTAAGVVRTVQLPAGLTGVTVTGNDVGSYDATTGVVTYTTTPTSIAAGGSLTSTINYTLASSLTPVSATATVSTSTNEAGLRDNNTATAVMPAMYDLATTLTGPTNTIAGSPTVLYVTTSNNGPNSAPIATQTVVIPSETALTNVYITNGGTYTYNTADKAGTVTFPSVNNLPSGASVTNSISFTVPVNDASPTNSSSPSAVVVVMSGETSTTNNTAYLNGSTTSTDPRAAITVLGSTTTSNNVITKANEQTTIMANATVVDAGTVVTYTVTAKNAGSSGTTSVSNVVQKVQLLPGLTTSTLTVGGTTGILNSLNGIITFASAPGGSTTYDTKTGVLTYPTITSQVSGATQTFDLLAVTVPANVGNDGQLLATASVSTASSDPVPADNTSSVAVKVKTTADLTATITGPTTTTAGQKVSYTATFGNNGLGTATAVVETVQLPIGLTNVVVQDPSGNVINNAYNATNGLVVINLASDASGTSQTYGISFTAPGQAYVVGSSISSGTPDNAVTNNASVLKTTVTPTADVAIYMSGPATAVAGNAVTYAVTATNNGPNVANTVTPTLRLPAGLTGAGPVATNPDNSSNNGVVVTGGGYYNATTGLVTFPTASLISGDSRVGLVTFTMPSSPTNGLVSGAAAYSFGGSPLSVDVVSSNNTGGITTTIAPATTDLADLTTIITPPASPTVAGASISYGLRFTNNSTTTAAIKVMPIAYLPAGLMGVVIKDAANAVVPGATYNSTTGQITFPSIDSQAAGNTTSYTVSLTAPANDVVISASAVSSNTSDPDPSNNFVSNTLTITPSFDVVTKLTGPTSATPGSVNTYTVTTTNNGPSTSPITANTTQTVTVPVGSVVTGLPATASYSNGVITFATVNGQATGANGAVSNTFMVQMPTTGTLPIRANVTLAGESIIDNNEDILTTNPFNPAPVALNVWNTLRSARGNTANLGVPTGLPISNLLATDDGTVSYTIVSIPSPAQGVLYYNGSAVLSGQTVAASGLSFAPTAGYVGNATFTYAATDGNARSNVALYTIPVAQDLDAQYATYNNSKAGSTYTVGTVLAQVVDPNAAVYSSTGIIYDNNGTLQSGAANGLPLTGTNATLTSGTLPTGVSLDPATGRLYVSGPLANSTSAQTYNLSITTTDSKGGTTIVPVTFTIGANPLPVTLVEFTTKAVANRDALLNWQTASEQHNDHFEVERSFDGTNFAKIGEVTGYGTTTAASAYTFTDAGVAAKATGPVYYRLRQVDTDGTATYSPLRTVSFTKVASVHVSLYPNPAQASTKLDLGQLPVTGTYQVLMLDATGRTVRTWNLTGGQLQPLELTSLANGSYVIVITGAQPDGSVFKQTLRLTKE
jgi:uncharacterized repeat protein (TIGR01451 family)